LHADKKKARSSERDQINPDGGKLTESGDYHKICFIILPVFIKTGLKFSGAVVKQSSRR
jgi:hypothetical protein